MAVPTAKQLTIQLKGRWFGQYGMICCPAHPDRTPSCKVSDGHTRPMFHCFAGCDWRDIVQALESQGILPEWRPENRGQPSRTKTPIAAPSPTTRPIDRDDDDVKQKREWASQIWADCRPLEGTLGADYLANRSIQILPRPNVARFHPGLKSKESGTKWPGVVFAYRMLDGEFDGIQRILIDPATAGKAPLKYPKLSLGTTPGSVMRLGEPERIKTV